MPLDLDAIAADLEKIRAGQIGFYPMLALDHADALCDEVARLRAALEPFADFAASFPAKDFPDDDESVLALYDGSAPTIGDCRRARDLLNPSPSSASSERTNG